MLGAFFFLLTIYFYFSSQRYIALVLLFALVTGGFQLVPLNLMVMPGFGITKTYDWVLCFTGVTALFWPTVFWQPKLWHRFTVLFLYGLLLIGLLYYSIWIRDVEVSVSVRVFRGLIYFITLFLFIQLQPGEIQKVFRLVIYITSLAALVYCLQLAVHTELLNKVASEDVGMNESGIFERYYNLPVFICPVIFFLFFSGNTFRIQFRPVLLSCNTLAILFSQHRNLLISVLVCYILYLFLSHRLKLWNAWVYVLLGIGVVLGADYVLGERFSRGMQDISQTSLDMSNVNYYEVKSNELSTTEFRQLLLAERLDYILQDKVSSVLGIGFITDDSRKANGLNFNVGMTDEFGNVTQVASGDIVWSVLVLQLGLAGTLLFLLFHLSFMIKFFSVRTDPIMQVGVLYILCLLLTSFYSNMMMLPYVTCMVMLFGAYYYRISETI